MCRSSRLLDFVGKLTRLPVRQRNRRRVASIRRAPLVLEELELRAVPTLLGQQLFPADYPWNQDISNAPVAANSAAVIAHIGTSIRIHPDWGEDSPANGNAPLFGIPISVVHGNTTPKINVIIDNYPDESDIVAVPMPPNPVIEGDFQNGPNLNGAGYGENGNPNQRGDSHLIIWDQDNNIAYEFFGASRPGDPTLFPDNNDVEAPKTDSAWHAAQESVWDMKTNSFRTLGATSADAAGLSILAGLARPDEGVPIAQGGQGAINHALRFTLPSGDIAPQYIYPASHVVNVSTGPTKLPFGARLRLANTPAVNAAISHLGPQAQIIARAMQQYGLVLADIGSAMFVTGTSAAQDTNNNISLTWDMNDVLGLSALTAGNFEVVDLTPVVTGLSASNGAAGNTITISGQNFSGAAGHLTVSFGNTAATSVTLVDDSHLTAVVPNGSGTVHVTVQSGVNEIDTVSSKPNANSKNPIFGYGFSATSSADQFTYGNSPGNGAKRHFLVTGADAGGGPNVIAYDPDTHVARFNFFAYDPGFTGGVRVAVGDVNGDGTDDIIAGAGPGGGSDLRIFDGVTGDRILEFSPYNPLFTGGQFLASADINGDGFDDIIVGADAGGGPNVVVYSGKDNAVFYNFFAYNPAFTGGVRVAAGDVDGDGRIEIICGAGPGGGPNITVFSTAADGSITMRNSFFAYDPRNNLGIYVAAGDLNGDRQDEIITGAGPGGGPNVAVFDGAGDTLRLSFFPYDPAFTGGVRVGAVRIADGSVNILTVAGPGGGADVRRFDGSGRQLDAFFAYNPLFSAGLFVGG